MATSYGFLSTHPPTECGLATFNSALAAHLGAIGAGAGVVRVLSDDETGPGGPGVVHTWRAHRDGGWRAAATALSGFDVAIIQHEYGIYPGADGAEVVPLLRRLPIPAIVVMHTVLARPTVRQRELLEEIAELASAVVTMTAAARDRLLAAYEVDAAKINVIPHGAADHTGPPDAHRRAQPHLLTWGLIGPGKGIEWAVRALAELQDLDPAPVYTVAGKTHPKVLAEQGESYRDGLRRLSGELGIADAVRFESVYRDNADLSRLIRSADVVILPYDSREQVTSGVLIEAVAAGVPVVATRFPHAVELLTGGPGLLVPHSDPAALSVAVRRILTEPGLAGRLTGSAGESLRWPAVAARYAGLASNLLAPPGSVLVSAPA